MSTYALCLLPQAIDRELTYRIPERLRGQIRPGSRVTVPLRRGRAMALVTGFQTTAPQGIAIKEILATLDSEPVCDETYIKFLRWVGDYYMAPHGLVLRTALPRPLRRAAVRPRAKKETSGETGPAVSPPELNPHQRRAVDAVRDAVRARRYETFLLHGVTGSGKTEVYMRAAEEARKAGSGVIVLVPEIALSYQIVARFKERFGSDVRILHSRMTLAERARALEESARAPGIAIGARSAVFVPMPSLGLVVVDEEQEGAYKQEEAVPLYHARECALMRAKMASCPALVGSATPSMESALRARRKAMTLIEMPERIDRTPLPRVEIVPMGLEPRYSTISGKLGDALTETLDAGEQALLFLNRRGFSSAHLCVSCGQVARCGQCSTNLVLHARENRLKCHWCGQGTPVPRACSKCGGGIFRGLGTGTQKVEAEIRKLFPEARVVRMDLDTTRARQAHGRLLEEFSSGDILIGTQMIAKGLDFPRLSLVGVILADLSLNLPDFRAGERTFQLITQVAGRAGRRGTRGRVLIQTFSPDHPVIEAAASQDYWRWYDAEAPARKALGYPPFGRLVRFRITGSQTGEVSSQARRLAKIAERLLPSGSCVVGPAPAMPEIVARRARWHMVLKGRAGANLWTAARKAVDEFQSTPGTEKVRVSVDIDPLNVVS